MPGIAGDLVLADAVDAGGLDLVFHVRIELFDHVHRLDVGPELADQLDRQRVGHAQLEVRHGIAEHLAGVLIRHAAGDDADLFAAAVLGMIILALVRQGQKFAVALGHPVAVAHGHGGHVVELGAVLDVGNGVKGLALAQLDERFRVAHARRHAEHHGRVVALGDVEGVAEHVLGFLRVRRLQHGDLDERRVVAVVLLVLRAVHARIVGGDEDHAAVDAHVGVGEDRVGSHVQTDMLHRGHRAHAAHRRADRRLHGDFLVRRPFGVDFFVCSRVFQDLRAGRARIGRSERHARLPGAARDGFVA